MEWGAEDEGNESFGDDVLLNVSSVLQSLAPDRFEMDGPEPSMSFELACLSLRLRVSPSGFESDEMNLELTGVECRKPGDIVGRNERISRLPSASKSSFQVL